MNLKFKPLFSLVVILCSWSTANAEDLIENVVVRNRLYSVAGRHELGVNFGLTMMPRLTDHYQFGGNYAYNFVETLSLELRGGYAYSRQTALAGDLKAKKKSAPSVEDARDLWEMNANGVLGIRWAPLYGKVALMAELPVHFQAYIWAGGGVGQFRRTSIVYCIDNSSDANCAVYRKDTRNLDALGSIALGGRFFLASRHSLRLEVRDYFYRDSYRVDIVPGDARAGKDTGREFPNPGLTHLVQFDIGYNFIF